MALIAFSDSPTLLKPLYIPLKSQKFIWSHNFAIIYLTDWLHLKEYSDRKHDFSAVSVIAATIHSSCVRNCTPRSCRLVKYLIYNCIFYLSCIIWTNKPNYRKKCLYQSALCRVEHWVLGSKCSIFPLNHWSGTDSRRNWSWYNLGTTDYGYNYGYSRKGMFPITIRM